MDFLGFDFEKHPVSSAIGLALAIFIAGVVLMALGIDPHKVLPFLYPG